MKKPRRKKPPEILGWREHVGLPELGVSELRAKIDTGARTSALHALDFQPFEHNGERWVSFLMPIPGKKMDERMAARALDRRPIKNTSGIPEERWVIRTTLLLGRHQWHIEVSLTNREKMEFDLILGRTAIRGRHVLVDPGRSFLAGRPQLIERGDSEIPRTKTRALLDLQESS